MRYFSRHQNRMKLLILLVMQGTCQLSALVVHDWHDIPNTCPVNNSISETESVLDSCYTSGQLLSRCTYASATETLLRS